MMLEHLSSNKINSSLTYICTEYCAWFYVDNKTSPCVFIQNWTTPLHRAAQGGKVDVITLLVKKYAANFHAVDKVSCA